jgi:hypothetical protein
MISSQRSNIYGEVRHVSKLVEHAAKVDPIMLDYKDFVLNITRHLRGNNEIARAEEDGFSADYSCPGSLSDEQRSA